MIENFSRKIFNKCYLLKISLHTRTSQANIGNHIIYIIQTSVCIYTFNSIRKSPVPTYIQYDIIILYTYAGIHGTHIYVYS